MHLISPFIIAVAWWQMRRTHRATADVRRANYYATRALRTLIAVGKGPIPFTASGVPADASAVSVGVKCETVSLLENGHRVRFALPRSRETKHDTVSL
ncbi:hypothetical protein MKK75_17625 [Methylobacterium sp. J-030]|uniref:hypothetical protein n=1 Tax=Methylobacterium sp. J-030 TaxID=2836627 RepID=UPI001FBB20FC|nr:hypothetical protein [Methylobacterium sp. J-030]MCJ2070592.1 hypothetical protein [Methylobacterium sp. J-030]